MKNKNNIAKIDNQLVLKAHYSLSASEQKLILFLISRINPKAQKDFKTQTIKIKDIEAIFTDQNKKWGSIYERVDNMCNNIMNKKITLPEGFIVHGKAITMHHYIQWFSSIEPFLDDDGEIAIKFQFAKRLKDFLLQLHRYVKINLVEVMPLRGKYTIRMYQIFKAERERTRHFKEVSNITYDLEELKAMLQIGGKYKILKDFRRNVLDTMTEEINKWSKEINVGYKYLKTRRKVTGLEFYIFDKGTKAPDTKTRKALPDYIPSEAEIDLLSRSKLHAFELLVDFGVKEGIAFRQMLPKILGGMVDGYEDIFVKYALQHFKKWSSQQKTKDQSAGTFVAWWTKYEVFSHQQDVFWTINEKIGNYIKKQDKAAKINREAARGIPNSEFVKQYKNQNS